MVHEARALRLIALLWVAFILLGNIPSAAMDYGLRGQASGWGSIEEMNGIWYGGLGAHYIPQLTIGQDAWDENFLDLEISLEAFAWTKQGERRDTAAVDLYRLKLRFATPRTETRIGLQQINFGPAYLLRPLRWFDRLDARDPLGTTEGVYALNFKYVTPSNASLWLWGLYGNDDPKGNEMLPTVEDRPEGGGRLEIPVFGGEGAFTFHHRYVNGPEPFVADFAEERFALDGRWDVLIGLWFEAALIHQRSSELPYTWRKLMTAGTDYTFGLGNGLHALLEHMAVVSSEDAQGWDQDSQMSGLSLSYPFGYADRISAIPFYYWESREYSLYAAWEHYWESFMVNVSVSHRPDLEEGMGLPESDYPGGGYGARLLLMYNH